LTGVEEFIKFYDLERIFDCAGGKLKTIFWDGIVTEAVYWLTEDTAPKDPRRVSG
jgi:hypothetical protein